MFCLPGGWPPSDLSEGIVQIARVVSISFNGMQLIVHHMLPSSNCHVHAQVVPSYGGRLLPSQHDLSRMIPVLAFVLIRMKKKLTVDLHSEKSKHGGNNAKSGCHTSKVKVRLGSLTSRAF